MSNLKLVFVLGVVALSGCGGTDPTASGVFPADGFTGRTLRVEISGDATEWKDGATVSFGDGVTVSTVTVASPTDLFAEIKIDGAAAPGLRDVTVSSGGSFTLKQAFELKSPIDVVFVGNIDQGGFPAYTITSHDFDTPFDGNTTDAQGNLANFSIMGPPGTTFTSPSVSAYSVTGFMAIDTDATPGPITISSGPPGAIVDSVAATVNIPARTATALSSGAPGSGSLAMANDTALFSLDATGTPSLVHVSISTSDQNASPTAAILDSTGHWANQIGTGHAVLPSAGKVYLVVFDGGTETYQFSVTAAGEMLTSHAEGTDTTANLATAYDATTTIPFSYTAASIASGSDHDFIKFTVDAGHANKKLHVITNAGADASTDTTVNVVSSPSGSPSYSNGTQDNNSQCSIFGCANGGEDVVTASLPMGTYAVDIGPGAFYAGGGKNYVLVMWLE